ncbi:hypothetical protein F4780DRAFT_392460 [Xylariomycetidae sp. FL0641]|nr:hypothetical protein F4780DRAFT_392460 [Xylariomycetidae sp. FL0641]
MAQHQANGKALSAATNLPYLGTALVTIRGRDFLVYYFPKSTVAVVLGVSVLNWQKGGWSYRLNCKEAAKSLKSEYMVPYAEGQHGEPSAVGSGVLKDCLPTAKRTHQLPPPPPPPPRMPRTSPFVSLVPPPGPPPVSASCDAFSLVCSERRPWWYRWRDANDDARPKLGSTTWAIARLLILKHPMTLFLRIEKTRERIARRPTCLRSGHRLGSKSGTGTRNPLPVAFRCRAVCFVWKMSVGRSSVGFFPVAEDPLVTLGRGECPHAMTKSSRSCIRYRDGPPKLSVKRSSLTTQTGL